MKHCAVFSLVTLALAGLARAANPALPTIPATVFNVTNYGAVGDGATDNTTSLQNAINAANAAGGGIVEIPAGTFLSSSLTLYSSMRLQVDPGGLLQMLPYGTYSGSTSEFIYCDNAHDLEICGGGAIDGQGAAWWAVFATNSSLARPLLLQLYNVNRLFIHDITFQNPPYHHCGIRDESGNVTISNLTVNTPSPSPNTDGLNFVATNSIIENCHISDGDDNIALGSTGPINDLLITNCTFGTGHGVSIGSGITSGITNMTVINCSFNNTDNGIRMKCNMSSSDPVRGLNYLNLAMTNVDLPIVIYSYYNVTGTPDSITPAEVLAASNSAPIVATTPSWSDITISNLFVSSPNGDIGGIIWGPTERPISNLTLVCITNTAPKTFDLYNVYGVNIIDCQWNFASGNTFTLCNAGVTISNSVPGKGVVSIGGATSTNSLALDNANVSMSSSNLFAANPFSISGSVLTNTGNLALGSAGAQDFVLGTNAATISVAGDLALGGINNLSAGGGFTNGTYTLMTYTGTLSGAPPVLGSAPTGYDYVFNTATAGKVNLVATSTTGGAPTPTTNTVQSSANPSTYGTAVTFTASVSPAPTNGEMVTFKDGNTTLGSGILAGGQAAFSTAATQLGEGAHSITAVYAGDGAYGASTSAVLTQTVNSPAGIYFNDTFGASTVNSSTPAAPTPTATSYEVLSGKSWNPTPSIAAGDLAFGIASTSSGVIETQARFASPAVMLAVAGDYVQLSVTFTNTAGILSQSGNWDFGLYNSGGVAPVAGGLNGTLSTSASTAPTGGAQNWQGYFAQIGYTGASSGFYEREEQTGADNNNQDVLTTGTSSSCQNPVAAGIGTASTTPSVALTVGSQYTEILTCTLTAANALQMESQLYTGGGANGALLSTMTATTGTPPLTVAFDGLAFGWRAEGSTPSEMSVSSVGVTGHTTPPTIGYTLSGTTLTLNWAASYLGWLAQSNSAGLSSANWSTVPNSGEAASLPIRINPSGPAVFYRLVSP